MLREALPEIVTGSVPGKSAKALLERRNEAIPKALCGATYPICIKRGEGAMLEDIDGNKFLDWIGGVGVLNIGYSNPEVIEAVKAQSEKYFHTIFNVVVHEGYVELAEKFNETVPCRGTKKKTYFANSGAEADENAIKVAKAYTKRPNVICFSGAFHGRTNLTMALTAKKAYSNGMGPFPAGIYRAEFPYLYRAPKGYTESEAIQFYIEKLEKVFDEQTLAKDVAAILVEPLQGEGGFIPAPIEWVKAVRQICDEKGIMLVVDEVQSGFCRTGKMFASCYWAEAGCAPDILATAKSIAAGVPLSAIVAREEIMESVPGGVIGGTFGGNALACASALKVIDIMEKEDFAGKAMAIGNKLRDRFTALKEELPVIGDIRGLGAMIGIEFVKDPVTKEPNTELVTKLVQYCANHGLLIENAGTYLNVVRFLAPLVITNEQLEAGMKILEDGIRELA